LFRIFFYSFWVLTVYFLYNLQEASNPPKGGVQSSGGHHLRDNNGTKKLGQGGGSAAALNWLSSRCTVL